MVICDAMQNERGSMVPHHTETCQVACSLHNLVLCMPCPVHVNQHTIHPVGYMRTFTSHRNNNKRFCDRALTIYTLFLHCKLNWQLHVLKYIDSIDSGIFHDRKPDDMLWSVKVLLIWRMMRYGAFSHPVAGSIYRLIWTDCGYTLLQWLVIVRLIEESISTLVNSRVDFFIFF